MQAVELLIPVLVILNVWTFMMFALDKLRAEQGGWRIRESTLLTLAAVGGAPGAYAGRSLFRHKTRKKSFSNALHLIASVQAVVLTFGAIWTIT